MISNFPKTLVYGIFNFVIFIVFIRFNILFHEVGHLLFAKFAGAKPKRIVLGRSHEITRFKIYGIKLIINKDFKGGLAFANFSTETNTRFRRILFVLGGPLTNILLAYLCYIVFGYNTSILSGKNGINIISIFIISNVLIGVISLIPYYISYQGLKLATDGLSLFKLIFKKFEKTTVDYDNFFLAQEKIEEKVFDEAIELYKPYLEIKEQKSNVLINISYCFIKLGQLNESFTYLDQALKILQESENKYLIAHVHNNMAWLKLLMDDKEGIDFHSKKAYSIDYKNDNFKGTRGSVLLVLGKLKQGLKLLQPLVDFNFPNHAVIARAMFVYYGLMLSDKSEEALKYFDFIEKHQDKFGVDDHILWNLLQSKLKKT